MAAALRVYGVLGSLTVRASSQQLVAAAKANAIGRVWRAANAAIKFQAITKNHSNDESGPESASIECNAAKPASGPFFGYFLWASKESDPTAVAGGKADPQGSGTCVVAATRSYALAANCRVSAHVSGRKRFTTVAASQSRSARVGDLRRCRQKIAPPLPSRSPFSRNAKRTRTVVIASQIKQRGWLVGLPA